MNNLFGQYIVYTAVDNNSEIICVEKLFSDKNALQKEVEKKKKRILNKHPYILNFLDYSIDVQKNLCSTFYLLKCFYEMPERNLKEDIAHRIKNQGVKDAYSMQEITYLLYHQVYANAFLQEKKQYHGDISPNNIFINSKDEFKLAFPVNETQSPEKVQLDKIMKGQYIYNSPILYKALKNRNFHNIQHNPHQSDSFSLGLTILEASLLHSVQSIYSLDNVDNSVLENYIQEFEEKYQESPLLCSVVRKMLEIDEKERVDFISLKQVMPDYEEIVEYFDKLKKGLIQENEDESFDSLENNYNFNNPYQGFNPNVSDDFGAQ